eukprot:1097221-Lingulodinium_polyedra.AAC.1
MPSNGRGKTRRARHGPAYETAARCAARGLARHGLAWLNNAALAWALPMPRITDAPRGHARRKHATRRP